MTLFVWVLLFTPLGNAVHQHTWSYATDRQCKIAVAQIELDHQVGRAECIKTPLNLLSVPRPIP